MNSLYLLVYMVGSVISYGTMDKNNEDYDVGTREKNFEELYKEGRQHYLDNNFQDCVKYIEAALSDYKDYTSLVNHCKSDCKKQKNTEYVVKTIKEYLHYEGLIRETLCLMKCKRGKLHPNRKEEIEDPDLVQDFQSRKTYDFLQLCYYQTKNNQSAANAAYTNLMFNQDHEIMRENLNYYLALPGVNSSNLVNLEEQEFVAPYLAGRTYYTEKNWSKLVESMELAVKLYLQEEDLLPLFYHYLQFAYFKVEDYSSAADCAVTYLELRPDNVDMQNNINYYRFFFALLSNDKQW
ncbi:cartilage-associated protein isoform X2 [Eurytemora carolleeae]|uniref:cartilage-associated protein isoform X2 n=1 Tax=Eurytemora carolleeae TaxID=1294199 RepID=UPI000C78D5BA|nr:cartilage-associated protein isoform X2 [Eurytemora carolleeae]|eukprot:XP_023339568.1 cartilage-associated protein-like isoform X2 [Eurytemora affinis]